MNVFEVQGWVYIVVMVAMLVVKGFALVNALSFSVEAYDAAGKLTKVAWCVILALGFAAQVLLLTWSPLNLIHLAFTIAAFVYLADVRPALRTVTGKR